MDELVRWLGEQLDEDERIAQAADSGPWKSNSLGRHDQSVIKLGAPTFTSLIQFDGSRAAANGAHVARHDPARVLREIEARRLTIDQRKGAQERMDRAMRDGDSEAYQRASTMEVAFRAVLRIDAAVYRDRPGYRDEWRP